MENEECTCSTNYASQTGAATSASGTYVQGVGVASNAPCPSCGYCPCCGRRNSYGVVPSRYWGYTYPYQPFWCTTGGTTPNTYTSTGMYTINSVTC